MAVLSLVSVAAIYYYWVSVSGGLRTGVTEGMRADKKGLGWLVAHSLGVGRTYKVTGVLTVIVVDKEGTIRYRGPYIQSDKLKNIVLQHM